MLTLGEILKDKFAAIELKKSAIKQTDSIGNYYGSVIDELAFKSGLNSDSSNPNVLKRTVVGNTYYYLDSHSDVHVKGTFTKSIKERGDKVFHLHDHEFKLTSKVGEPQKVYEKEVTWKELGLNAEGKTIAVLMDTDIRRDYNEKIFNLYATDKIDQHSVSMRYIDIELAVNSKEKDFEDEKKIYDEYIDKIINKEEAEKRGYFWVVKQAALIEISAVLAGSNPITPTLPSRRKALVEEEEKAGSPLSDEQKAFLQALKLIINN